MSEEKKLCNELKEKASEAMDANLTEKDTSSSESVGDGTEKCKDSQVVDTELPTAETNPNDSKSDERKMISANENINPSELPVNRYLYNSLFYVLSLEYNFRCFFWWKIFVIFFS